MYLNGISLIHCGALCIYESPVVSKEYAVILGEDVCKDLELFVR